MPPELRDPGDPAEWLRRARSNLAKAKAGDVPDVVHEDLCFDAQQASEKALEALLVRQQVGFPTTHAIGELDGRLGKAAVVTGVPNWISRNAWPRKAGFQTWDACDSCQR